jgi:predicted DNA-binding protein (MmcQ/YjbR family)
MDVAALQDYCLAKPGAWPDNPWDHDYPVIKVADGAHAKIFAFLGADSVGVKAGHSREVADEWLQRHPGAATVMAYIGRSGWNSLSLDGAIPDEDLLDAVDESYRLVVEKLPRKHRPAGWEG